MNNRKRKAKKTVIKSVSLPAALARQIEERHGSDPEFGISRYIRRLIRRDLSGKEAA